MEPYLDFLLHISFRDDIWMLLLPGACIAIDIFTGVLHAWVTKHLKSYRLREGLGKKVGELCAIVLGELLCVSMDLPKIIIIGISIYITFMEIVSIFENFDKLGVPIPKAIKRAFGVANNTINTSELSNEALTTIKNLTKEMHKK